MSDTPGISLLCEDPQGMERAQALANDLGLPLRTQAAEDEAYALVLTPERLELRPLGQAASGPVSIDWLAGRARHRRLYGGGRGQPLARALGLKPGTTPRIIDATAGLGRDAFVLAHLGCKVRMLERSPLLAALLEDALQRAAQDPDIGPWIHKRLELIQTDAIGYLNTLTPEARPEAVYLDPMYPKRGKAALVKKEMQTLQTLIGPDTDSAALLQAALRAALKRVAVKRPIKAPPLEGPKPDAVIKGKTTRYDVYLRQEQTHRD